MQGMLITRRKGVQRRRRGSGGGSLATGTTGTDALEGVLPSFPPPPLPPSMD